MSFRLNRKTMVMVEMKIDHLLKKRAPSTLKQYLFGVKKINLEGMSVIFCLNEWLDGYVVAIYDPEKCFVGFSKKQPVNGEAILISSSIERLW